MALSATSVPGADSHNLAQNKRCIVRALAFDNSYPTNGLAFTPAMVGMQAFYSVEIGNRGLYSFEYDYVNRKVKVYIAGAEVANATNLNALVARATIWGF